MIDLSRLLGRKPSFRPVPTTWQEAPLDMQEVGYKAMLVLHVPVKKDWPEQKRLVVAQEAANAAIHAIQKHEDES